MGDERWLVDGCKGDSGSGTRDGDFERVASATCPRRGVTEKRITVVRGNYEGYEN